MKKKINNIVFLVAVVFVLSGALYPMGIVSGEIRYLVFLGIIIGMICPYKK